MTDAVLEGFPKREIEKMATTRQARIDNGEDVIVGVNKYRPDEESAVEVLDIDNDAVWSGQTKSLDEIRASRDDEAVKASLSALQEAARNNSGNLLALLLMPCGHGHQGELSSALRRGFWPLYRQAGNGT